MPRAQLVVAAAVAAFAASAHAAALRTNGTSGGSVLDNECPMSRNLTSPQPAQLALCASYADLACCTAEEDAALKHDFDTLYRAVYDKGCPGCLLSLRELYCGLYCAPTQRDFLIVEDVDQQGRLVSGGMRVYDKFCTRFYDACKTKWPATEYAGLPMAFCEASLDSILNVTMLVTEDTNNVFMRWAPNHCDGTITGGPLQLDSSIGVGWIIFFTIVTIVTVTVVTVFVYALSNRKKEEEPKYEPVEQPDPEPTVAFRVVGAGLAIANGNFFPAGAKNDTEFYRNHNGVTLSRERLRGSNQMGWVIGLGGAPFYGMRTSLPTPPRSGWRVYARNGGPPPTVILVEEEE